jgi:hypothetical protein
MYAHPCRRCRINHCCNSVHALLLLLLLLPLLLLLRLLLRLLLLLQSNDAMPLLKFVPSKPVLPLPSHRQA